MAREASSSDSSLSRCSYDVFLSFRGEDTRKTFTDHLYTALVNEGFRTFRDDDEIERGEDIKPELQKAIQQSRSSVIVFSKDYASSRWCLNELVMILQCKRRTSSSDRHVVLPVFYDIDPSHLRNQTGSVEIAFARHQKTQSPNKVNEWRAALAEVADLGGMVLHNQADGYESKFIGKIVKVIGDKLRRNKPLSVAPNLIGMHSRVKGINSWLQDGSNDVGILVIYGIPGMGKTTIAKHVYNSNFRRFERRSFLENIRGISEQYNGVVQIQTQLLSNILNGRKVKIQNVSEGLSMLEDAVSSKRVLLVLDDVDHMDQLNALLSRQDRFYPGSKIIITTRNARLSKCHLVTKVHTVESLDHNESLELFSWHAFGQDHPVEGYMEHSKLVVHQSGGLPLAIQILGSSLMGESTGVWESALKKLQSIPNGEIMSKLRICYDSLQDDHDRKLFLDIACFFVGKDKHYIVGILDGCDFHTTIGFQNLIDRCLVTIDEFNKVHMHDMIRDMGREIVRLESEELGRRSRIWHHKDSFKILGEKCGTESIEGLVLDMYTHHRDTTLINSNEIVLETEAFSKMQKLRLLHLDHVQLHGCYGEFPTRLRSLCWFAFPLDSIPIDFSLENLVVLEMQYSSLKQMWKGTKCLPSLKILDLSHSHGLTKTIDFSRCPHLEKLALMDCASLIDVHDSIGDLKRLVYLNMKDCINIRMLPKSIFMLKLLETLIISGCSNLNESSMKTLRSMESLKVLEADRIPSQSSMEVSWPGRRSCIFWTCLPRSLVELSLMGCNLSDDDFSRDFDALSSLERLNLDSNQICSLPSCIKGLKRLHHLSFSKCRRLESLVGLPKLVNLNVTGCLLLRKIIFQLIPCTENKSIFGARCGNLVEFGYEDNLVNLGHHDVEVLNLINFWRSNSMAPIWMKTAGFSGSSHYQQPYSGNYDFGILNTFLSGNKVPGLFSLKSRESTISFTVPLHPNHRIGGLNFFFVYANSCNGSAMIGDSDVCYSTDYPMVVKVRNKSKGLKWIYPPEQYGVPGEGEDMMWLSHWKFWNDLEGGDQVAVSLFVRPWLQVKELGIECVHQEENMSTQHDPSMDPCYPYIIGGDLSGRELMPGTYFLCDPILKQVAEDLALHRPTWFSNIFGDSDKDTDVLLTKDIEEDESEEGREEEEEEGRITLAAKRAGIDNCCGRGWKMSKESSERNYDYDDNGNDDDDEDEDEDEDDDNDNHDGGGDDGGGDDDVDIKLDSDGPDGGNVEHGANQSVLFTTPTKSSGKRKRLSFTDLCAESSKKRNEMFEQRSIGSESLPGNNAVQSSVAKDVSDEECLMQCVEILNKMEEIDDDSYSKALSFTDLCAESSKKRNEMFEQRFIGSESLPGNNAVQSSVAKDVSDEECLMQCVEILNKMEEIDDDSYSKALSFTDLCAESSKKRNEMFEQRFIGSESLPGNNAVQSSVAKDVSDEECLMQCVEILNKMEEINDDSYSKALKLFHGDATWRKIFLVMPDQRRKNFIIKL